MRTLFIGILQLIATATGSMAAQQIFVAASPNPIVLQQICQQGTPSTCQISATGTITLIGIADVGKPFAAVNVTARTQIVPGPAWGFDGKAPQNWLTVSGPNGVPSNTFSTSFSNTLTLTVSADPNVILTRSATYIGYVNISAPGMTITPALIPVQLANQWFPPNTQDSPAAQLNPSTLFTFPTAGGSVDVAVNFPAAPSGTPQAGPDFLARVRVADGVVPWLNVAPGPYPIGSKKVTLTANPAGLSAGRQVDALLEIQGCDSSGTPNSVASSYLYLYITPSASLNLPSVSPGGVVLNPTNPGVATISPGSWVSIYGTNLAPNDPNGRDWGGLILGSLLPASIDGVSVTIDGKPAAISYVQKDLINVQAPDDSSVGPVNVVVTTPNGTSLPATVNLQRYSPALFTFAAKYAIGQIYPDNALAAPPNISPGVNTRAAKPGDIVSLWGTGFGPTATPAPAGFAISLPVQLAPNANVQAAVGGVPARVIYAGLTGAGLNQIQIVIPQVGPGDQELTMNVAGVSILSRVYLAIGS